MYQSHMNSALNKCIISLIYSLGQSVISTKAFSRQEGDYFENLLPQRFIMWKNKWQWRKVVVNSSEALFFAFGVRITTIFIGRHQFDIA